MGEGIGVLLDKDNSREINLKKIVDDAIAKVSEREGDYKYLLSENTILQVLYDPDNYSDDTKTTQEKVKEIADSYINFVISPFYTKKLLDEDKKPPSKETIIEGILYSIQRSELKKHSVRVFQGIVLQRNFKRFLRSKGYEHISNYSQDRKIVEVETPIYLKITQAARGFFNTLLQRPKPT